VSGSNADHLSKELTVGCGTPDQFIQLAYIRQQRLQRPAQAVAPTDAEQILGAGIQIDDRAIGINNQDGR